MVAFSSACTLQVIAKLPCQVPLDDARQFAEQFDPAYQLTGETVYPAPQKSQQHKAHTAHTPDHSQRKEKLKHKEKKKRRKRRKAT